MTKRKVVTSKKKQSILARFKGLPLATRLTIVLVSVSLLFVVATLGYTKYQERDLRAQAGRYTTLVSRRSGVSVSACRVTSRDGISLVRVFFVQRGRATNPTTVVTAIQNNRDIGSLRNRAWFWSVSVTDILVRDADMYIDTNFSSRLYRAPALKFC